MDVEALRARRAERVAELERVNRQLEQANQEVANADAAYRATGDGLGESLRAIELTKQNPAISGADRKRMFANHIAAEKDAAAEYRERTKRWGQRRNDGPLHACPIGTHGPLVALIAKHEVTGSYRLDPTLEGEIAVQLVRPVFEDGEWGRKRCKIRVPASMRVDEEIPIDQVIRYAVTHSRPRSQLQHFVGDQVYRALADAAEGAHV